MSIAGSSDENENNWIDPPEEMKGEPEGNFFSREDLLNMLPDGVDHKTFSSREPITSLTIGNVIALYGLNDGRTSYEIICKWIPSFSNDYEMVPFLSVCSTLASYIRRKNIRQRLDEICYPLSISAREMRKERREYWRKKTVDRMRKLLPEGVDPKTLLCVEPVLNLTNANAMALSYFIRDTRAAYERISQWVPGFALDTSMHSSARRWKTLRNRGRVYFRQYLDLEQYLNEVLYPITHTQLVSEEGSSGNDVTTDPLSASETVVEEEKGELESLERENRRLREVVQVMQIERSARVAELTWMRKTNYERGTKISQLDRELRFLKHDLKREVDESREWQFNLTKNRLRRRNLKRCVARLGELGIPGKKIGQVMSTVAKLADYHQLRNMPMAMTCTKIIERGTNNMNGDTELPTSSMNNDDLSERSPCDSFVVKEEFMDDSDDGSGYDDDILAKFLYASNIKEEIDS